MPACLAHFAVLSETARALEKEDLKHLLKIEPVKEQALRKDGRDGGISQYAYLGSVSPDLGFFSNNTGFAAYLIHNNKSGSLGMKLVEYASGNGHGMLMALALGYISHIAADIVVHPYVNILAGATQNQRLSAIKDITGGPPMHMVLEGHQDSWIARNYFGSRLEDVKWNHFISALPGKGIAGKRTATPQATKEVLGHFCSCFKDVYGRPLGAKDLWQNALGRLNTALLKGYGSVLTSGRIPKRPSQNLVDYNARIMKEKKKYKLVKVPPIVHNDYRAYLKQAVSTSTTLCRYAIDYFYGRDPKSLPQHLRDWNLDTGYRISVYKRDDGIHIRYEHSWAHNYGLG